MEWNINLSFGLLDLLEKRTNKILLAIFVQKLSYKIFIILYKIYFSLKLKWPFALCLSTSANS